MRNSFYLLFLHSHFFWEKIENFFYNRFNRIKNQNMSYKKSNKSSLPCCGVCQKKGYPASVYNSHNTKTDIGRRSVVTCPEVLSYVCSRCNKSGHSVKYCTRSNAESSSSSSSFIHHFHSRKKIPNAASAVVVPVTNSFLSLDDDEKPKTKEMDVVIAKPSYLSIAKLPGENKNTTPAFYLDYGKNVVVNTTRFPITKICWADLEEE